MSSDTIPDPEEQELTVGSHLFLDGVRAIRYRMPLKKAYGTARGKTTASTNFIVIVEGRDGEKAYVGMGESQPRHVLTGDGEKDRSSAWRFLVESVETLQGMKIDVRNSADAIRSVKFLMRTLRDRAGIASTEIHGPKPFRGTLLGVEVALLDLVSRYFDVRLSELLGEQRLDVPISISTISTSVAASDVVEKVSRQTRFPITRLKGRAGVKSNLDLLSAAVQGNQRIGERKPLWIDLNEAMTFETASDFVAEVAGLMKSGELPSTTIIEGPLPKQDGLKHADLQLVADDALRTRGLPAEYRIEIMPDESMWDADDLRELVQAGGCKAINIKAPKAGGLLESLELAEAAVAANPETRICIGGMLGTSELTAWALHNLARAMPRLDYVTTVPPRNVETIAFPRSNYAGPGSNVIRRQEGPGLGTEVDLERLAPYVEEQYAKGVRRPIRDETAAARTTEARSAADASERPKARSWRITIKGDGLAAHGYVDWLYAAALEHDIHGWVCTREDGAVDVLMRGTGKRTTKMISRLCEGPSGVSVSDLEIRTSETVPRAGFRVREGRVRDPRAKSLRHRLKSRVIRLVRPRPNEVMDEHGQRAEAERPKDDRPTREVAVTGDPARANDVESAPSEGSVPSLEVLGRSLSGSWANLTEPDAVPSRITFLLDQVVPGSVLVLMDAATWTQRLRRSSRQSRYGRDELCKRAVAAGAVAIMGSQEPPDLEVPYLKVRDSREATWNVAHLMRRCYSGNVVGITGTVGKSTTAAILAHILQRSMSVSSSYGNWNTVDGVSNTLSGLDHTSDVAVVEAAISGFVRIPGHSTADMINPDVAIITAIGLAHRDIAPTVADTARIKGSLIDRMAPGGVAIINADTPHSEELRQRAEVAGASSVRTFGRSVAADCRLLNWDVDINGSKIEVELSGTRLEYRMQTVGEGAVLNGLGALLCAQALGMRVDDIRVGLETYAPKDNVTALHEIPVRGGTALLIDDSTNATVDSMNSSFKLLWKFGANRSGRRIAVLGQINFLGDEAERIHASLAEGLIENDVDLVFTTGNDMDRLRSALGERCGPHAHEVDELPALVRDRLQSGDTVLVKGSSANTRFGSVAKGLRSKGDHDL
ncbi:Mur ligase family protein [Ruania rhizosphaerae]|uniref:Mur ligase family protein n=1 Tax=Ruania rhizosphaerae TaxID=1840413 RepID=UPI00135CF4D8|nr:Mur ligase family protein [Ruania rhizosphaerae]